MDSAKVIKELEDIQRHLDKGYSFPICWKSKLILETLELLKEQEAKTVMESTNMYTGLPITHCPKCGISLDRYLYGRQDEGQINSCPK
jgi:hypothetical protein